MAVATDTFELRDRTNSRLSTATTAVESRSSISQHDQDIDSIYSNDSNDFYLPRIQEVRVHHPVITHLPPYNSSTRAVPSNSNNSANASANPYNMASHDHSSSPTIDMNRNRLPTLFEVLARRTLAPVDLYFFYLYMRDQQRAVDYLDFWLDVAQHMSVCRHYVRELRRSVMIGTPDGDKTGSKRSSALLENLGNLDQAGPSVTEKDKNQDAQMSAFLREDNGNGNGIGHSPSGSTGSNMRQASHDHPRPSFMNSPQVTGTDSSSPQHTISRADIRASAEKILYTYLLPMSEREIGLPDDIRNPIIEAIEVRGRDDPEVFDAAKDWVFQAMERDAFPGFLRSKALGNLVPPSMMFRLIFGLVAMFAGYWAAFVLIFLDNPRSDRLYLIIPFTLGVYGIVCWYWSTDPFLALAGYSEHAFFKLSKIHEPFVKKLLMKRALMALVVFLFFAAGINCLFIFVPGYAL